jgi:hypothetical protein
MLNPVNDDGINESGVVRFVGKKQHNINDWHISKL